jgi:hypothetical protein
MPTSKPTRGASSDWERKRRLAEIFGDVLPKTTRDEREETVRERGESTNDAWLKSQVPPHHGG